MNVICIDVCSRFKYFLCPAYLFQSPKSTEHSALHARLIAAFLFQFPWEFPAVDIT